jgi:hypothetical protein
MKMMPLIRRIGRKIVLALALIYFLLDVFFLSVVRPIRQHVMAWRWVRRMREWVLTLNPYVALLLLLVPWLILEPLKPLGFLLFRRHHHLGGTLVIVFGELGKLAIFDQVFDMTKPKLLTLHWFAQLYGTWQAALDRLRKLFAWQAFRAWRERMRRLWRSFVGRFAFKR